ncbi:MAG: sigma 54-dependent Fis family transcriptional regulator [Candidatus Riflebacteria bacterium]|nr:sigma 54-dependent Fis family transcriptional regulator [Candidatus Riflebacteria bacterium]
MSEQTTQDAPRGDSLGRVLTLDVCRLVCVAGPDRGREWTVEAGGARIGTHESSEVRIDDPTVSRHHALVKRTAQGWLVEDRDSRNGVLLDGVPVRSGYLRPDSVLTLGTTQLRCSPREKTVLLQPSDGRTFHGVVAASPSMRDVIGMLQRVAPLGLSILLTGPTGTGKGVLARAVHRASPRNDRPFEVLDCANVDENLIRAELFGHEKGAFTGADQARPGIFETAAGGTLFIDEIGELPLDLQPRLLKVLEDREIRRLGSQKSIPVDVRIVAATHRDLGQLVRDGRFREDLLYRLCVVEIAVPPLARRREDVEPLALHFLTTWGCLDRLPLSGQVLARLSAHDWPGNVRELRNVLERAVALAGPGPMAVDHLVLAAPAPAEDRPAPATEPVFGVSGALDLVEREAIIEALAEMNGNKAAAARKLGVAITTLRRKMEKFGLE